METETFEGKKFNKLIEQIEEKHQENYKIIKQRQVKRSPLLFWLKKYEIEIELVKEEVQPSVGQLQKHAYLQQDQSSSVDFEEKRKKILDMLDKKDANSLNGQTNEAKKMQMMEKIMEEMMAKMEKKEEVPPQEVGFLKAKEEAILLEYYERLLEAEVLPSIAENLIKLVQHDLKQSDWDNAEKVEEALLMEMENLLQVTGELDLENLKVMALIGPTGVGKTTTIAKIAGYMIDRKKKVGLITTDVFRIGATDQLQIYANILDSEMIAVNSPEELEAAIEKLTYEYKVDIILIDTVGRSPLDVDSIDDVNEYLEIANPDHVGLVLSSTQKTKDVQKILENFQKVPVKSVVFTKLDETLNHGVLLNAVVNGEVKISYITNGQNVPYDIYQAESEPLAKKILNGVDEFGSSIFST